MFRPAKMVKLYCLFYEDYQDEVLVKLQRLGLVQFFNIREEIPSLMAPDTEVFSKALKELERVNNFLRLTKPREVRSLLQKLLGPKSIFIKLERESSEDILIKVKEDLDKFEEKYSRLTERRKRLAEIKNEAEKRLNKEKMAVIRDALIGPVDESRLVYTRALGKEERELSLKILDLEIEIDLFEKSQYPELLAIKEKLENLVQRMNAIKNFGITPHVIALGCWVPKKDLNSVIKELNKATEDSCITSAEEVKAIENVPVLLHNPWFLRPYEILTESYGLPKYNEIDPTPFLAITFTMFFGIMLADIGFGITLTLLSMIVLMNTTKTKTFQRDLNILLMYAGTASMVFGLLYGEFFWGLWELTPLWRNPREDVVLLLILSVGTGVVHITLSLILRLINQLLAKKSVLYPLSILLILWSGGVLLYLPTFSPAKFTFLTGILLLIMGKRAHAFVELLTLFANLVSYARLGLVYIVHVVIARIFFSALFSLSMTPLDLVMGIVLFVFGIFFLFAFDVFYVFITSLRLHWVEFFKRYYLGFGEKFKPFSAEKEYTYVI